VTGKVEVWAVPWTGLPRRCSCAVSGPKVVPGPSSRDSLGACVVSVDGPRQGPQDARDQSACRVMTSALCVAEIVNDNW